MRIFLRSFFQGFTRLMPCEWALIVFGVFAWALYHLLGLPMPGEPGVRSQAGPGLFYFRQLMTSLDLYALVWIAQLCWTAFPAAWCGFRGRGAGAIAAVRLKFGHRIDLSEIFQDLRFFHAVLVMFVLFGLLKHLIPFVEPRLYDDFFATSDRMLCGGLMCGARLHQVFGTSPAVAEFISGTYFWYFPYMTIVMFVFVAQNDRKLAQEFCSALVWVFLIGILWVYLIPTLGPVYWEPQAFHAVASTTVGGLQHDLAQMRAAALEDPMAGRAVNLISGFPSLHVAVTALGSIYLARLHKVVAALSAIFLLVTINSTLYLGWHYLLDDLGSICLTVYAIGVSRGVAWWWRGKPALSGSPPSRTDALREN
jgi:membrane-associated phospholipid phosphatase